MILELKTKLITLYFYSSCPISSNVMHKRRKQKVGRNLNLNTSIVILRIVISYGQRKPSAKKYNYWFVKPEKMPEN